jgi:hypothetical protein
LFGIGLNVIAQVDSVNSSKGNSNQDELSKNIKADSVGNKKIYLSRILVWKVDEFLG